MDVATQQTGIIEGEEPPNNVFSEEQYFREQKNDLRTEFGKRRFIIAEQEHIENPKDIEWSKAVGDTINHYMSPLGRGERAGACFLRGYNARGALDEEKKNITYLPENYIVPKEIFDRIEQKTECGNLRRLLEIENVEIIMAEIGYRIHHKARKQDISESEIDVKEIEVEFENELYAWISGLRYQQCGRHCQNRANCEKKKRDIDNYTAFAEQTKEGHR